MSDILQVDDVSRVLLRQRVAAYVELTKPRIAVLVLIATALGFLLGLESLPVLADWVMMVHAVVGTAMVAAGANALNQYIEADHDAEMTRTADRPLPSGRLTGSEVLSFSILLFVGGVAYLALQANLLAALLAAITWLTYGFVYTPLKRKTTFCIHIGAIPGALPPVIGWAAASGTLSIDAAMLFGVLLVWQLPHFASIAWIYREDYRRAGYAIISVGDSKGMRTSRHMVVYSVVLIAVSLLPVVYGPAGVLYGIGAVLLGLAYLASGIWFLLDRTTQIARWSLLASITYLPCLFILMMIEKVRLT